MTGAELDTKRRRLGLSIAETAAVLGLTERSVNRAIRNQITLRPEKLAALTTLEATMRSQVAFAVEQVTDLIGAGPLPLARYLTTEGYMESADKAGLPPGAHAMLCAWLGDALEAEGVEVQYFWVDAKN